MIKNENYITIQGFMVNELHLKGNELLVYAIIFGFCQSKDQRFTGSLQYLAEWTNSTKQGVLKNLKSLLEKGYIVKEEKLLKGVKFCEYYTTEFNGVLNKVEQGIKQSLTEGIKQSLPNNIDNNTNYINNNIIDLYSEICTNLPSIKKINDKRKTALNKFAKEFTEDEIKQIFNLANSSEFLTGKNDRGWKADFDFILRTDKATAILEGKYSNKTCEPKQPTRALKVDTRTEEEYIKEMYGNV